VLPTFFRRRAKIEKWAFFHGRGNTFNIWNPEALLADEGIAEETRELVEFCMEEKGLR
jgi:MraZ protein